MTDWTTQHARELYNIRRWGQNFFDISAKGQVVAQHPEQPDHPGVELPDLARALREQGLDFPVLIRFIDILHFRIKQLYGGFTRAISKNAYQGRFTPVYPIKVNQQFSVVSAIVNNPHHNVGLEAGSKTELYATLSLMSQRDGVIICNGYKDKEFVRLALIGERLGFRTYIVLEKLSELPLVLEQARLLSVKPRLGVRIQLSTVGCGRWQNTGGEKSKFGLTASQVLSLLHTLQQSGQLDILQLLHFHLGSQIPDIKYIEDAIAESTQYLAQLHQAGCNIRCMDVGGGLGVDYEGSNSDNDFSINYNLDKYAECIVSSIQRTCQRYDIPHPDILTESGRAMTAHHAVLITNVVEFESTQATRIPSVALAECHESVQLDQLQSLLQGTQIIDPVSIYTQASGLISRVQELFSQGQRNLQQRATCEQKYRGILECIQQHMTAVDHSDENFLDLINQKLATKYFCNFSLFQSLPDIWALNQIFPIMPLQRLLEKPDIRGLLRDITCDSDGRIDHYIENNQVEQSLRLHPIDKNETYLLGFFLVGAYQEILGDMHNLFGDTHSVNVCFTDTGYTINHQQPGDSVNYILNHIHFDPKIVVKNFEDKIKSAMLSAQEAERFIAELKIGMSGYSYLKSNE